MSKFIRSASNLKMLVDNSFRAIDEGAYETQLTLTHDSIDMRKAILSCPHAPLITEVKFSSPSAGKIRDRNTPTEIAGMMVRSGAVALSVLTQPHLFAGSLENLARVRREVSVPIIMKDIVVSRVQVDAAKKVGADCVLMIKTVFDQNLAEETFESLAEYAGRKGLQVLVEAHAEQEFADLLAAALPIVGINNRDLDSLEVDISTTERLLHKYGKGKSLIVSESGISSASDIQYLHSVGADAYLVGTSIMQSEDLSRKVSELYNAY